MASTGALGAGHIPSLDGLRAVSIAVVFAGHAGLPPVIRDTSGVTIFFFLSGFLITTLLNREYLTSGRVSLRDFYIRRAFRILPAMYIVFSAALLLNLTGLLPSTMTSAGALASGLQVSNYWIILNGRDGLPTGMNALWSLAVEEHFYLIFPILQIALWRFLPSRKSQAWTLGAVCAGFLAWRCFLLFVAGAGFDRLYLATDTRAASILLGALMAIACNPAEGRPLLGGRRPWLMFLVGIAGFAVARVLPEAGMLTFGHTIEGLALFLIFTAVIVAPGTVFGRFLNWKPVAFIGVLSYSLYLVHRPILMLLEGHLDLGKWPTAGLGVLLSLAVSYALYRLVEKPMQRLRHRFSHVLVQPSGRHGTIVRTR